MSVWDPADVVPLLTDTFVICGVLFTFTISVLMFMVLRVR